MDFPDFMQQIVGLFELQARNKGLSFDYAPAGELPAVVRADEKRLRQILINVLGNAVKFTVRGGVSFSVECRRDMATFEIHDSGPGIPAADMERIFEPFVARQHRPGGRQRRRPDHRPHADRPDGRRNARSRARPAKARCSASASSCRKSIRAQAAQGTAARLERIGYAGARRRMLVVDNEKDDRDLLHNVLEPLGFIVEQAASGYECLAAVPRFAPDVIFMDLGHARHRRLGDHPPAAPVAARRGPYRHCLGQRLTTRGWTTMSASRPTTSSSSRSRPTELLDWLGGKLDLQWLTVAAPAAAPAAPVQPAPLVPPNAAELGALDELISLGYLRGILNKLAEIERMDASHAEFVRILRDLARQFQFDAMKEILRKMRDGDR